MSRPGIVSAATLVAAGLVLLPWLFVQAATLPSVAAAQHWSAAWVGLDSLEAIGLVSTGLLVRQGARRRRPAAAATAALLIVDAWFDTVTAVPGSDLAVALVMAVLGEVPLALLCAATALRADHTPTAPACAHS
ncbi:hypothetical protein [Nocardia sp. NPDC046763]|uniref:hypothetical protein n=1 Tax=Nocardia sp. NPDC046763 TaxID=3155256 RepID=UPI0033D962EE